MEGSADKQTLECRTGGQKLVLRKIPKSSKDASTPLRKKRARAQKRIREQISGGSEDAIKQHGTELKVYKKDDTNKILKEAGHGKSILTAVESIRMQTEFEHSNTQHRAQKQLFKEKGIIVYSQREEDTAKNNALCNEITIETQSVIVNTEQGDEKEDISVGKVKDLPIFVEELLNKYDNRQMLTWQGDKIPKDGIWLKLGGDHGKGSFKLTLQILNVQKPNSPLNTFCICLAECRDSRENLDTILKPFKEQIDRLSEMKWNNCDIQLFLCGDYEFLIKVFGLSGAAGVHPCLFCEITSADIQKDPSETVESWIRSLRRIKSQHQRYVKAGSVKKNARHYKNVISKPMWNIELTHVAPPYLHIVLGLVKKHHDLLEEECHELDIDLALHLKKPTQKTIKDIATLPFRKFAASDTVRHIKKLIKKKKIKQTALENTNQKKTNKETES